MLAARGARGEKGDYRECGDAGPKGDSGSVHGWLVARERYRVSVRMTDGTIGPMLELRPLFEQFFAQALSQHLAPKSGD